ncbi:hypothetical protein BBJ28_00020879 [Nothophytophthora sp. Chile5]|nr:hypothetical protein BBJ28_00020879 [Nothophytophthora sp. Chile5]
MSYSFFSVVNAIKDKVRVSALCACRLLIHRPRGNHVELLRFDGALARLNHGYNGVRWLKWTVTNVLVDQDVAELSKTVRQSVQERRLSVERSETAEAGAEDQTTEDSAKDQAEDSSIKASEPSADAEEQSAGTGDPLTALKNSLFSFDVSSTLGSLNSVGSSVGSKLGSLNVGSSLGSLEAMGSKLLNSADTFLGTLAGDTVYEDEDMDESALSARRFRLLALQEDSETYIDPPLDAETFQKWKLATTAAEMAEIQADVLEHYPTVGAKFTELVPSVVEGDVFWAHYIYKASLLAAQEKRGADLLEHALNDSEEEIGWDVDSPRAKEDEHKAFFPDDESKEEEKVPAVSATSAAPATSIPQPGNSSSDGESWIELDERKESTSSGASSNPKEPTSALTNLKLDEGDEEGAAGEDDSLDWGDDDDLAAPVAASSETKAPEVTAKTHEEGAKHGEDWGEWD